MPVIERPNILFCLFDSFGVADSGLPEPVAELPALSQLCAKGAFFNRTYTPCSESSPARASLFTGLDPCVHGLWTNGVTLPSNEQTFSQRLMQAGYSTYLAGRYQLAGVSRWTTEQVRPREFSQLDWAHGPLHQSRQNAYLLWLQNEAAEHYAKIFVAQAIPDNTKITQQQRAALKALPDSLSFNYWVGRQVQEWISSQSTVKPFMAIASFTIGDLHGTEPHPETDSESINSLALQQADAAIGRMMKSLDVSNRLRDTVVIVASARGSTDSKSSINALHEKAIRVPLLFHGPGFKHKVVTTQSSTIDIAPTILEIANVPIGPRMQGESLLSVLNETTAPRTWSMCRIRKTLPVGSQDWQTALIVDNMKLIVTHNEQSQGTMRMFNLDTDPLEQNNLAGIENYAGQLEDMIDQMVDARCALEDRTEPRIAEF